MPKRGKKIKRRRRKKAAKKLNNSSNYPKKPAVASARRACSNDTLEQSKSVFVIRESKGNPRRSRVPSFRRQQATSAVPASVNFNYRRKRENVRPYFPPVNRGTAANYPCIPDICEIDTKLGPIREISLRRSETGGWLVQVTHLLQNFQI